MIGVLGEDPKRFDFLATIQNRRGSAAVVTPVSPRSLPDQWQALDPLSILVIDAPLPPGLSKTQLSAIHKWLVAGGNIVLAPGVWDQNQPAGWPFASWVGTSTQPVNADAPSLHASFPQYADLLARTPCLGLRVQSANRVLWKDELAFIATRTIGQGRVTVVGIDWSSVPVPDLRAVEGLRASLWRVVLQAAGGGDFSDTRYGGDPSRFLVPREALAKHLKWHFIALLLTYAAALGLLNWLILRRLRRMELSVITLPAGAILLSIGAWATGVHLRGTDARLTESSVIVADDQPVAALKGHCSFIKADRRPVSVSTLGRDALYGSIGAAFPCLGALYSRQIEEPNEIAGRLLEITVQTNKTTFHNLRVPTWTLYQQLVDIPVPAGGGARAAASFSGTQLVGRVEYDLPFSMKDSYVVFGWHRCKLGTLAPGSKVDFAINLRDSIDAHPHGVRCPGCGRFHGSSPLETSASGMDDLPKDTLEPYGQALAAGNRRSSLFPAIVGFVDNPPELVRIDRAPIIVSNRAVCVVPVTFGDDGSAIDLPVGILVPESIGIASLKMWPRPDAPQFLPAMLKDLGLLRTAIDPATGERTASPALGEESPVDQFADEMAETASWFSLPPTTHPRHIERVSVRWFHETPSGPYAEADETSALLAFNWTARAWATQAVASANSTNLVALTPAADYFHQPSGSIVLRAVSTNGAPKARWPGSSDYFQVGVRAGPGTPCGSRGDFGRD